VTADARAAAAGSVARAGDEPAGVATGAFRVLGRTGVRVSSLCLGGMNFGAWANADHEDSARIVHTALDAGINFVDTADVYSAGESEEIIGKALAGRRDGVVLATKFHNPMGPDANHRGNSRRWIVRAVEDSLRRLGTDWIDLYQMHRPEPETDLEETIDALSDLVRAGKIRYFGSSTCAPHQIVQGQWAAARRNLGRFVTEQPPYSLLVRKAEAELLPVCREYGLGVLSWSPLAAGWLSGSFHTRRRADGDRARANRASRMPARFDLSLPANQAKLAAVTALAALADEAGTTLPRLAIAFVLQHPAVTAAIVGPRTVDQLTSILEAGTMTLDDALLDRIDEIVAPGTTVNPADDDHLQPIGLRDKRSRRHVRSSA
jgi:aryl-alcohol dehydrogenase-like predicted oxidoreductase